jgi:DNA (cytosine-5)-methyltransferase 1
MFAGGGMLDQGVELAFGPIFRPIAYVECEAYAAGVLAAAMEGGRIHPAPVWSDARTVCGPQFRHYVREAGGVDAIVAGYPCPDFSCAGKREGLEGVKGSLWFTVADAIEAYEPELLFLENVGGHASKGFDTVSRSIRDMGYRIAAGLFTASEVGSSHERERLFILADAIRPVGESGAGRGRVCQGDPQLADAQGIGVQGLRSGRFQVIHSPAGEGVPGRYSLPLFPPHENNYGEWQRVLAIAPSLEPEIYKLADGMADRAHQLRLLGNGVVPLEAAYAYTTLGACLWGRRQ